MPMYGYLEVFQRVPRTRDNETGLYLNRRALVMYEPMQREKTCLLTCAPNEDSDPPVYPRILIISNKSVYLTALPGREKESIIGVS